MKLLDNEKLETIEGGESVSGALINAFTSAGKFLFEVGRSLGSSIRRIFSSRLCQIRL